MRILCGGKDMQKVTPKKRKVDTNCMFPTQTLCYWDQSNKWKRFIDLNKSALLKALLYISSSMKHPCHRITNPCPDSHDM